MKRAKGSYSVELALLLPLVLFALYAPIYAGYRLYAQTRGVSACGWDESFCAEERVRKIKFAEGIVEGLK